MNTNLDFLNAHEAIELIKQGTNVDDAIKKTNAKIQIINIMTGNENVITEDVFVEENIRVNRKSICDSCEQNQFNTCMQCACPLPTIINMKFKECPLGKW